MECSPTIEVNWAPDNVPRGLYRRLFFSRRPGLRVDQTLPHICCKATGVRIDAKNLADYQFVIQEKSNRTEAPLFYPHALFGSAHLSIICHESFPVGALGLLHVRNHVIQYRSFDIEKPWDLQCELTRQRHVKKGLEFDFDSTVTIDGEIVWHSISTYLKRGKPLGEVEESPFADLFPALDANTPETGHFDVPNDIGRRYAKVTGDYNPIHVSTLAAKLFGFKRAIAHGMWSVGRALQELPKIEGPVRHDVTFKGPLFVTSKAAIKTGDNGQFDVFCDNNPRPVIVGAYQAAFDGETLDVVCR